jgi:hypothetical protein
LLRKFAAGSQLWKLTKFSREAQPQSHENVSEKIAVKVQGNIRMLTKISLKVHGNFRMLPKIFLIVHGNVLDIAQDSEKGHGNF